MLYVLILSLSVVSRDQFAQEFHGSRPGSRQSQTRYPEESPIYGSRDNRDYYQDQTYDYSLSRFEDTTQGESDMFPSYSETTELRWTTRDTGITYINCS